MMSNDLNQFALAQLPILSDGERRVMELILSGYSPTGIAEKMGVSQKSVSTYKRRIHEKLGLQGPQQRRNLNHSMMQHYAQALLACAHNMRGTYSEEWLNGFEEGVRRLLNPDLDLLL